MVADAASGLLAGVEHGPVGGVWAERGEAIPILQQSGTPPT